MAGIYIHIPFCKQACNYCNFHFSTSLKQKDQLLDAIHSELEMRKEYLSGQEVETIYFGGGTPSLLTSNEINQLTETIHKHYNVKGLKEFTLEANPDDLNKTYLSSLRDTLIDRFSIGTQSFIDRDLKYMNRAHNAQEADYAIKASQDAGFTDLTIDLIYGTPGLTDKDWLSNLNKVKRLGITHFSAYALTVEEGTVLHHNIQKKKATPVDPEQSAVQMELLMNQCVEVGFEQYEISNFAANKHYAVHNTNYWTGKHYLGIGPSAHSFDGKSRSWNMANNALYIKNIQSKDLPIQETEHITPTQHLNEYIMTSLRTMWGCDLDKVSKEWGSEHTTELLKLATPFLENRAVMNKENKLILTTQGKLIADRIAGELFI